MVQQEELKRRRQGRKPFFIKGPGDDLDNRRYIDWELLALAFKKKQGLIDNFKILGIDADAQFPDGTPAAGSPLAVIVGCGGFFPDDVCKGSKATLLNGYS